MTPGSDVGPHENVAAISGSTPSSGTVSDYSTDGIDPDADGDDTDGSLDDDDIPEEDDPTPISFNESPALGVAKFVSTVECVLDGDLAAGADATTVISTVVSRSASGTVANSADVESDGPVTEPVITDNTDVDTISIGELPRTGSDLLRFTVFGLLFLLAGAALVMGSRQVRSERD